MRLSRMSLVAVVALGEGGCGLGVSQLPEVWDRTDSISVDTARMENEIKKAIFCELMEGAKLAQAADKGQYKKYVYHKMSPPTRNGSEKTWSAQVTLTLTADEKSSLTPSVSFKEPISPATIFKQNVTQSFALGTGGTLTSQNVRYDKYTFLFSAIQLLEDSNPCKDRRTSSTSSPFVDATKLGIREWLPGAVDVINSQPLSAIVTNTDPQTGRETDRGFFLLAPADPQGKREGADAGAGKFVADVATYDNKFVIVSSANLAATWNLVRIGTGTTPLFDLNRTRTHELLITLDEAKVFRRPDGRVTAQTGPSQAALNSHFASQIGSAVSAAIGNR